MPAATTLRDRLLESARALLRSGGVDAVGIREVARQAGVSHGAPRRHFATRELLLAALAAEGFEELGAAVAEDVDPLADPTDGLVAAARTYVRFAARDRARFELMFRHDVLAGSGADLRTTSLVLFDRLRDMLADVRDPAPTDDDVALLWTAIHGVAVLAAGRALDVLPGPPDADDLVRQAVLTHLAATGLPQSASAASIATPERTKPRRS